MGDVILSGRGLRFTYPGASEPAVDDFDVTARPGRIVALVGPNGSGKTTVLKLLLGLLEPQQGSALVKGRPASEWKARELARTVGVVAQREEPVFPIRVREAVLLGRYAHMGALGAPRPRDRQAVEDALRRCDATYLADRWVATLSGGEWQRVRVARALAQQPEALILDEPTASLDLRHEMELFTLVSELVHQTQLACVLVTHHVNLAARFADLMIVLERGRIAASGSPAQVLTSETLLQVFRWPVSIFDWKGVPQYLPELKDPSTFNTEGKRP